MGARLDAPLPERPAPVEIVPVRTAELLAASFRIVDDDERHSGVLASLDLGPAAPIQHRVALKNGYAAGAATTLLDGDTLYGLHLAVAPEHRRAGIGGAPMQPRPPRERRARRGPRAHAPDHRLLPLVRLRAAPPPARALVLPPVRIRRAYGSAHGSSFALIARRRDNSPMSSPSSPLDRADSAQLNSWMSRVVLRPAGPEDRDALDALAALDNAAAAPRPRPAARGGRPPARRPLAARRRHGQRSVRPDRAPAPAARRPRPAPKRPSRVREFFRRQASCGSATRRRSRGAPAAATPCAPCARPAAHRQLIGRTTTR